MIWNFCIRRPVFTAVIFLVIAIFGGYGYFAMPVRENPDIEFPIVSVNVVLAGAEPEVIETEILDPLEEEINTVEGLKQLTSTAREQVGTVTAEFELWRNIDIATQDVRDRVNRARRELPDDVEQPIVRKLDPDARAILWIALRGDDRWDAVRLSQYADEVLKERLENIRGAGRIQVGGERRYAVRIRLDAARLAAYGLSVDQVVDTIRRNNVDIPTGRVESASREFLVKTEGQFATAAPLNDLIIAHVDGSPVRLEDVGQAVPGIENDRQTARFSQEMSVGLGVVKQSDANTVALAEAVRARIEELSKDFPPGLSYTIATDDSRYVRDSINSLLWTIVIATVLVVIVVLAFLRNIRGTIITALAIPSSLLGGIMFMHVLGFSINNLTMLGLILAIGIVIDDAVVVLESCYRHLEEGADPAPAASVGATEVAFPSIANTLSLSAVFIPVAFTAGLIGRFFFEFGLTVAATVFVSTFTALTLTPMLSSRLLRRAHHRGRVDRSLNAILGALESAYRWVLDRAFRLRIITVLLAVVAMVAGILIFRQLSTEFSPSVDREEFLIRFETPEGSTLDKTDQFVQQVEDVLTDHAEVSHFFMAIGLSRGGGPGKVNQGLIFVHLTSRQERQRHQSDIVQELRHTLGAIPGGRVYLIEQSGAAVQSGAELQLVLQHPDLDALARQQAEVMQWMRAETALLGVRSDLKLNKPQAGITIDHDKALQMGVSILDISNTLRYLLGEPDISEVEREGERYEVIPEIIDKGQMTPQEIGRIHVRNDRGDLVALENLVDISERIGPSEIHHFNRIRSATISASTPPDVALGDVLERLEAYLEAELPREFDYAFAGTTQDFQESFYYLTITLVFSVLFIYLVLAAQFESFLDPLVILLTLPLAAVGAFGALYVLQMPFGIFAFIGLIMLTGMATKNAILLIDYTNVLVRRGRPTIDAAKEAANIRFRPVVMTTISTVLGLTPIAMGFGAGGEARAPMGVAVAAGLAVTTLLTLVVIPVVYSLIHIRRDQSQRETQPSPHEPIEASETEMRPLHISVHFELADGIVAILDQHGVRDFTQFSMVHGADEHGKHYGTQAFPGNMTAIHAEVPVDRLDRLMGALADFKRRRPAHRHLRAYALTVEQHLDHVHSTTTAGS